MTKTIHIIIILIYIYIYSTLGVSPTKDFHSQIGIFESCQYSTDSQIISLGAWSKYITKSQVRHSTVIKKCVTDASQIQTGK